MKAYRHKMGEQRSTQGRVPSFAPVRGLRGLTQIHPLNAACSRSFGLLKSCGPVPKKYIACTLTFPFLGTVEHKDKN
jgi:hypothetical protein